MFICSNAHSIVANNSQDYLCSMGHSFKKYAARHTTSSLTSVENRWEKK